VSFISLVDQIQKNHFCALKSNQKARRSKFLIYTQKASVFIHTCKNSQQKNWMKKCKFHIPNAY
jgi:hypothetical protein